MMSTTTAFPVTIAPEARAFIDNVGQREAFDLMLERANRVVPGLMAIDVELGEATDEIPAAVVFWTHRDDTGPDNDPTQHDWIEWMAATFPAERLHLNARLTYARSRVCAEKSRSAT
jgi:hypothetical protein